MLYFCSKYYFLILWIIQVDTLEFPGLDFIFLALCVHACICVCMKESMHVCAREREKIMIVWKTWCVGSHWVSRNLNFWGISTLNSTLWKEILLCIKLSCACWFSRHARSKNEYQAYKILGVSALAWFPFPKHNISTPRLWFPLFRLRKLFCQSSFH